jgi:hypothetical protein
LQIIDYQNQQYQLFGGLSTCYAMLSAALYFRNDLDSILQKTNSFKDAPSVLLAKVALILHCDSSDSADNRISIFKIKSFMQYRLVQRHTVLTNVSSIPRYVDCVAVAMVIQVIIFKASSP